LTVARRAAPVPRSLGERALIGLAIKDEWSEVIDPVAVELLEVRPDHEVAEEGDADQQEPALADPAGALEDGGLGVDRVVGSDGEAARWGLITAGGRATIAA